MDNNITNDVNDAVRTGISGEAVKETVEEIVDKDGKVPAQFKDTVEVVAEMKNDKPDNFNPEYESNLVQNNSNRIKEALNEGIEPGEIATEIARTSVNANTNIGMKKLNFITKLISKMKRKERKKQIEQQVDNKNTNQKVYTLQNKD